MIDDEQHSIRKIAILISSIDSQTADALLDQMSEDDAARARHAVMQLDDINPQESEEVLRDFLDGRSESVNADNDTNALAPVSANTAPATLHSGSLRAYSPPAEGASLLQSLGDIDAAELADGLRYERPQTIAVVVSQLNPKMASDVLAMLPRTVQADVLKRVAGLNPANHDEFADVHRELAQIFVEKLSDTNQSETGLSRVRAILGATDGIARLHLLENLSAVDSELASRIRSVPIESNHQSQHWELESDHVGDEPAVLPFNKSETNASDNEENRQYYSNDSVTATIRFDDLVNLSDFELAEVFRSVGPDKALLALTGADDALITRLVQQLPASQARAFRRQLEQPGPLRLSDIQRAQEDIIHIVGELGREGKLQLPKRHRFVAAA